MSRKKKKVEKKKELKLPEEKINDIDPKDQFQYDERDPYGKRLK